jgi:methylmalonyl-CoA mutase N-terminal domain/subunit
MYDPKGRITRQGAEQAIREGGSVIIGGTIYTRVENLPSEADFAQGDQEAENRARENLLRQRQALDEQLAKLGSERARPVAPAQPKPSGENLDDLTVAELKDRARDAEVKGFSDMNKAELIDALKDAGK